jgi:chitodextrinase
VARKVIIRRGLWEELPTLDIGELGYAIDTEGLYIGSENGNVLFAKKSELDILQQEITDIQQSAVFTRLGVSENGLLTIDGIEQQLTGGGSSDMTLVVKDYFEGSTNITKTYTDNMVGFSISNDAGTSGGTLTFTINGMTIPVKATESYEASFLPFKSVTINTTVPYRATVSAPYGATFDTIAPLNITGLVANNITTSDLTLTWNASTSSDTVGYDVYKGSTLLNTVAETTFSVTGLTPSTSYTFTVKAKDNSGNISSGTNITVSTLADTIAPNDVTNLVASNVLATSVSLSWTASTSTDVAGYQIYNGSNYLTTVTGTTYNVTGLSPNTNYTFTVKAKDGYNNIATGATASVLTAYVDTTAPNDVTGLSAGTATVNSIPVGWTLSSSSDVANYEVAYSSDSGSTWTVASALVNNSSTSYTLTGLTSGTTYTIRVVAIDTSGNRSTGASITKATASNVTYTVSATPSSGTYNTTQNVVLSVNPTGAIIYYTTNGSTPTTSSTVYSSPIAVSANMTIKFLAQDASGNATSVQTAIYTIDTVAPTVTISPVSGTYNSTQTVQITSNEGTIYYTLDGTTPTTSSTVYSGTISVSATQTVKYLVVDAAGNQTTGSATYTIDTTSPDPVTNLAVGTVTYNSIPVTWTAPSATDVSKYEVAYSSNGGSTYTIATSSLSTPATSYTVTGLTASTTYTIRVVAIDTAGNRSTPTTVNASTPSQSAEPSVYLQMNGTTDYIKIPSMQFTQVVLDIKPTGLSSTGLYVIDARSGVANGYVTRSTSAIAWGSGISGILADGTPISNNTAGGIPDNTRKTYTINLNVAGTDDINIFANSNNISGFVAGNIYSIKVFNGATLMAHYDTSLGHLQDQSGNNNHGILTGGTWVGVTPRTAAQYLQLNGGIEQIRIPNATSLQLSNNFTISAKFAYDSTSISGEMVKKGTDYQMTWSGGTTHKAKFYATGNTGTIPGYQVAEYVLPDTNPHTVAYQYDGTTFSTLVDGATALSGAFTFSLAQGTNDITIGYGIKVKLYEVKIIKAGTTVMHIDCTKGTLADQSGNNNNGILTGGTWVA